MINVRDFGAAGDGKTDDTRAIQAAIDVTIQHNLGVVFVPAGQYLLSQTLQLGYGAGNKGLTSLILRGEGQPVRGEDGATTGTTLIATFKDRPCIAISGGRNSVIESLTIKAGKGDGPHDAKGRGLDYRYGLEFFAPRIASNEITLAELEDPYSWIDPTILDYAKSRYAPFAAIAIDPYHGPQPTPYAYPEFTYPDWTGIKAAPDMLLPYGVAAPSSNTMIRDVQILGFVAGVVATPSGGDGNGDFLKLHNCTFEGQAFAVSVSHTQSRNVELVSCGFNVCHTIVTTARHGLQNGRFNGRIDNCSGSSIYQLIEMPNAGMGPTTIRNFYCENLGRIGVFGINDSTPIPIVFDGCSFEYLGFTQTGHAPGAKDLKTGSILRMPFFECHAGAHFDACNFTYDGFHPFAIVGNAGTVSFTNCRFDRSDSPTDEPEALAHNYFTGSCVVLNNGRTNLEGVIAFIPAATAVDAPKAESRARASGGRARSWVHQFVREWIGAAETAGMGGAEILRDNSRNVGYSHLIDRVKLLHQDTAGKALVIFDPAKLTLTFDWTSDNQGENHSNIRLGHVLYDDFSQAIFVVTSVTPLPSAESPNHYEITATMYSNFRVISIDSRELINQLDPGEKEAKVYAFHGGGNIYLFQTDHKFTSLEYRGDFQQGEVQVTNIRRPDGTNTYFTENFRENDILYRNDYLWDHGVHEEPFPPKPGIVPKKTLEFVIPAMTSIHEIIPAAGPTDPITIILTKEATATATNHPIWLFR